jgi:hypothetical protein
MRWTKLLAASVLPAVVGCGTWFERPPSDARTAWRGVREQHPQHRFTTEFETGFHDGYAECVNCGGGARPPAVPPVRFLRERKYLSAAGHGLVRDYYSGFQYGSEVAATQGHGRNVPASYSPAPAVPYVTTPSAPAQVAPVPEPRPATVALAVPNKFSDPLEPRPVHEPNDNPGPARPKLPKPEVPVIPPFSPDLSKFKTVAVPEPDRLPPPVPALPVLPALPERPLPQPNKVPDSFTVPVPSLKPPANGPDTPAVSTELPFIPFKH